MSNTTTAYQRQRAKRNAMIKNTKTAITSRIPNISSAGGSPVLLAKAPGPVLLPTTFTFQY